jgi:pimeloyl-ACP methyl ester carboxylesterase
MTAISGIEPSALQVRVAGRTISGLDWGGSGPSLVFLHANGLCAGVYDPIARRLAGAYRPIGVDLAGHGRTDPPNDASHYSQAALASDVAAFLDGIGIERTFVVGASLGGGVAIWLNSLRPGLVAKELLAEAVAFEDRGLSAGPNSFSERARRRRAEWPSREAIIDSYGSRPPFASFEPESLAAYVRYGTVESEDGTVRLACDPEVEASYFDRAMTSEGGPGAWTQLEKLRGRATIVCGKYSDMSLLQFGRQAQLVETELVPLEANHLLLHEDTDRAVELIETYLTDHETLPDD